jgi:hypothetical protein
MSKCSHTLSCLALNLYRPHIPQSFAFQALAGLHDFASDAASSTLHVAGQPEPTPLRLTLSLHAHDIVLLFRQATSLHPTSRANVPD